MERGITPAELKSSLEELLRLTTMTIATVGDDGEPHAAAVYFDQLDMYFFSGADSQHTQDATQDSLAAAAVHPECSGWQDIHGLQMRGSVKLVQSQDEWPEAWEPYLTKLPFVAGLLEIVVINQLHKFIPKWIRWVDNRRGFGFMQEWEPSKEERAGVIILTWTRSIGGNEISRSPNG